MTPDHAHRHYLPTLEPAREPLPMLLVGAAALLLWAVALWLLLTALS